MDIYTGQDGVTYYIVENDEYGDVDDPRAYNAGYALIDCTEDDLEKFIPS